MPKIQWRAVLIGAGVGLGSLFLASIVLPYGFANFVSSFLWGMVCANLAKDHPYWQITYSWLTLSLVALIFIVGGEGHNKMIGAPSDIQAIQSILSFAFLYLGGYVALRWKKA